MASIKREENKTLRQIIATIVELIRMRASEREGERERTKEKRHKERRVRGRRVRQKEGHKRNRHEIAT